MPTTAWAGPGRGQEPGAARGLLHVRSLSYLALSSYNSRGCAGLRWETKTLIQVPPEDTWAITCLHPELALAGAGIRSGTSLEPKHRQGLRTTSLLLQRPDPRKIFTYKSELQSQEKAAWTRTNFMPLELKFSHWGCTILIKKLQVNKVSKRLLPMLSIRVGGRDYCLRLCSFLY